MTKKVKVQKTARPPLPAFIDYKDLATLRAYLSVFGRIVSRYYTGVSLKQQKKLSQAIKRAREMALIPYTRKG